MILFYVAKLSFVLGQRTVISGGCMKSQDILLLLKLVSLRRLETREAQSSTIDLDSDAWHGWEINLDSEKTIVPERLQIEERYSLRNLESMTGVSKTEISASFKRSKKAGLLISDRVSSLPRVNQKGLLEFIVYGLKYVFPVSPGPVVRGIPTSFAAPVMMGKIMSGGDLIYVWQDARGSSKGQMVEPLYKTVPKAVKQDAYLYELLALIDALRLGSPREISIAKDMLERLMRG